MNRAFKESFEKTAFIPAVARWGTRVLTRHGTKFLGSAKNVGTKALQDPLKAGGAAVTAGFTAMDVGDVANKVQKSVKRPKGFKMTNQDFFKVK